jgi:hypothetical protein
MTYKADSLSDWPMQVHNGKQVYGEAQLFVLRDGKWTGGKFDHVHPNGEWRDFKNVVGEHKDYLSITPVSGEPSATGWCLMMANKKPICWKAFGPK